MFGNLIALIAVLISLAAVAVTIFYARKSVEQSKAGVRQAEIANVQTSQANENGTAMLDAARDQLDAARRQVAIAKAQADLQREQWQESLQPNVWADIRPHDENGGLLMLYVGNAGPTVATDVRVTFDPPLDFGGADDGRLMKATDRLTSGIASLPPGRRLEWSLGVAGTLIPKSREGGHEVTIVSNGPYGTLPAVSYPINVEDRRHTLATPPGSLYGIADAITKSTGKLATAINALASETSEDEDRLA